MAGGGVPQPPRIGVPLDEILSPFSLPDFQIQPSPDALSQPSSPTPRAPPANKRRKIQFTEEEVERRLLKAVSEAPADTRAPLDNRLLESSDMTEICNNLRQIDSMKDNGLIMQAFAIGRIIVEVVQQKIGSRSDAAIVQELKKFNLPGFGKTKVAEAKRFYRLGTLYPRLLKVTSGFTAVELTQAARFIERVCEKASDFWKTI